MKMLNFSAIILIVLLGVATCDIECFRNKVSACQEKSINDYAETFCEMQITAITCTKDAALDCKTGFEVEASNYLSVIKEVCKEGTKLNKDLHNDENCGINNPTDSDECVKGLSEDLMKPGRNPSDFVGTNKILCKWIDVVKECVYKNFEKHCKKETVDAYRTIYESAATLQKKICSVLPANGKRSVGTVFASPFLALL